MPDLNITQLLEPPEYEQRARSFELKTSWRINNTLLQETNLTLLMSGTGDYSRALDHLTRELESLADNGGEVFVSDIARAQTGVEEVDTTVGWDLHERQRNAQEEEIFSADNFRVSCSLNCEEQGTFETAYYDWELIERVFAESCKDALAAGGKLDDLLSASVYRRSDGTVCVQLFFAFTFNTDSASSGIEIEEAIRAMQILINQIKGYNSTSYTEYSITLDES